VLSSGWFGRRSAKEIQRCSGDFIIGTKFADTTGRFFRRYFSREIFSQDAPDLWKHSEHTFAFSELSPVVLEPEVTGFTK